MQSKYKRKAFPPNSKTAQGYASCFVMSQDGKWLGYCLQKTVVLRNVENPLESKAFTKHCSETTAIAFHPQGKLVASSDVNGNIIFWEIENTRESKKIDTIFAGKINGLVFTDDGANLLIYGNGKGRFAKVIDWNTGKDVGDFSGILKNVISGCLSKAPYRLITGGEDGIVTYYDSLAPQKHLTIKEHMANKFISSIICSPDGTKFVSVGFDKKIVTYDVNDGKVLDSFDTSKAQNGHKMAIVSSCFLDADRIVTCSIDRSVKVWNLKEKTVQFTLIPKEGKLDTSYIMCGVQTNGKVILALTLNGVIHSWNVESLADNKLPDLTLDGSLGYITQIVNCPSTKEVISGDSNGKILIWGENGIPKTLEQKDQQKISYLAISSDNSLVYSIDPRGSVIAFDRATLAQKFNLKNVGSGAKGLAASRKNNDDLFVLYDDLLVKINKGKVAKQAKFDYKATALEINEELGEILVGDIKGKLHVLDMEMKEKSKVDIHFGEFSVIRLSPDGKLIASGDNQHFIKVYEAESKKIITDRFGFHTAKIFDISWSFDSKFLVSASLDFCCMMWDIEKNEKIKDYVSIDGKEINACCFINENKDFACGGNSCVVNLITFE